MFRTTPGRRAILGLAAAAALTLSMGACGSESDDSGSSGAPVPSASADTSLADKVPADIKAAGTLSIGNSSLTEGNSGDTDMVFTVTRTGGSVGAVAATWTIANVTTNASDDLQE